MDYIRYLLWYYQLSSIYNEIPWFQQAAKVEEPAQIRSAVEVHRVGKITADDEQREPQRR